MNAQDRKLLELAANAAGIRIDKAMCNGAPANSAGFDLMGNAVLDWHNGTTWNPLTDDGDALRLAVRLGLQVGPNSGSREPTVFAWARDREPRPSIYVAVGSSGAEAATRRAIVRVAAAIGEAMP